MIHTLADKNVCTSAKVPCSAGVQLHCKPLLERIRTLLDRFNVFEAIGFVGQELMHSQFLAFLLDPKQNHGLEDAFLRRLLYEVSLPLSQDLRDKDLGNTLVHREWGNVDAPDSTGAACAWT